jgi:quinol monooxygenase YgiN
MRITVVARRTAYPGQEAALLAAMEQRIVQATPRRDAMQSSRLFQGLTAPTDVLYIGEWESREAHWERVQENRVDELLAPLTNGPCVRYFLRRWVAYETPWAQLGAVDCVIIDSPPARRDALHQFVLRKAATELRAQPGFCYRRIYQDLDEPNRLLIVHGWTSPAAMQTVLQQVHPSLVEELRSLGIMVETFIGVGNTEMLGQAASSTA